jgi:hypothetical protein
MLNYQKRVEFALVGFLRSKNYVSLTNLALLLGNPQLPTYTNVLGPAILENEPIVRDAWIAVFEDHSNESTTFSENTVVQLLVGLLHKNRWKALMEREDTAYKFVAMMAHYFRDYRSAEQVYAERIGPVQSILWSKLQHSWAEWIPPLLDDQTFTLREFSKALFGEAWCMFMYDDNVAIFTLAEAITRERPQFLPGRIRGGGQHAAQVLPELG